ncbi:hypothetical protein [Nonomuraea sp. NPDC048916]|uniref:hypothetical protein n=1 Tax=Nonomuraea sp. NPDC048916 TaxID=3154232 RepID=UPI0033EB9317
MGRAGQDELAAAAILIDRALDGQNERIIGSLHLIDQERGISSALNSSLRPEETRHFA